MPVYADGKLTSAPCTVTVAMGVTARISNEKYQIDELINLDDVAIRVPFPTAP